MSQKKDKDEDKENLNEDYYKAQKDLIRRREIENRQAKRRLKRIQQRNKIRHKLKNFFQKTGSRTFEYVKKFFDPAIIMPLIASCFVYREIAKLSNTMSSVRPITPINEPEIHVDNSFSGQVKNLWSENWPKIMTGSGVILITIGRQVYLSSRLQASEAKLETSKVRLQQAQRELKDQKAQSDLEMEGIKKDHGVKVSRLHVTLNRFNNAALASAQRETMMRTKIQECQLKIGELIEERDLVQEQVIVFQKVSDEKDEQIQDLDLEKKVLSKQLEAAAESQAELSVKVEELKKDKSAGILSRHKLKRRLIKAQSDRKKFQKELHQKKIELNNTNKEKQQIDSQMRREEERLHKARRIIDNLKDTANTNDRELQKAIETTDKYALKMDETQKQLDFYEQHISAVTQEKNILQRKAQQQEELIGKYHQENDALKAELEAIRLNVGTTTLESDKLISQIEQAKIELTTASKEEQERLTKIIKDQEKELKATQKMTKNLKEQLKTTSDKFYKSMAEQQDLTENYTKLQEEISKERDKISKLKSTIQKDKKSYFSILQMERAGQKKNFNAAITRSEQLINEILDKQDEARQSRPWWQRIPLFVRLSPQITIKQDRKESVEEIQHHFYPSFVHVPESITERRPGKEKVEISVSPKWFQRSKK